MTVTELLNYIVPYYSPGFDFCTHWCNLQYVALASDSQLQVYMINWMDFENTDKQWKNLMQHFVLSTKIDHVSDI